MQAQHLIIDGYNMIYANSRLKSLLDINLELARNELIKLAVNIYENEAIAVTVIFDGKGDKNHYELLRENPPFEVIFSAADRSADSLIEQISLRGHKKFIAATQDRMISQTLASLNAQTIDAETFVNWAKSVSTYKKEAQIQKTNALKKEWEKALKEKWKPLSEP